MTGRAVPTVPGRWTLDPSLTHLNHGSYGACPIAVLEAQRRWRDEIERDPTGFFDLRYDDAIENARQQLAQFVGADPTGMVFVPNSTTGVNAVLRSVGDTFDPGDELLVTDHTYNACRNAVDALAQRTGARVVVARIPFPIDKPEQATEAVLSKASSRTKLALVDHVTSATALVLPIAEIVDALEPDVPVLVDGAHAPGMAELDVDSLSASYAVGNCHKWICAPKGAGYLSVRTDRRDGIEPLVISHGWRPSAHSRGNRLQDLFDWPGTHDPSAWFSVPDAIATISSMRAGGWPEVRATNRDLALAAQQIVCDALGVHPPCPAEMIGSMGAVQVGGSGTAHEMRDWLRAHHRIVVPVSAWPTGRHRLVRWSAHIYNEIEQYERLASALVEWERRA